MSNQNITLEEIIKTYKNNYSSILHEFISVQSDFYLTFIKDTTRA